MSRRSAALHPLPPEETRGADPPCRRVTHSYSPKGRSSIMEIAGIEPAARREQNPQQVALLPANALSSCRMPPRSVRLVPSRPFQFPAGGAHWGHMRPNKVNPPTEASGPNSSVSQGSRETRGRRTVARALARRGWGGVGGGARVGVPADTAGGDCAVRGG